MVEQEFGLKMPIPVIVSLMKEISRTCSGKFILNKDHSFIIRSEIVTNIGVNYEIQKDRIHNLENNYVTYCKGFGVEPKFNDLISFIQDQKIEFLRSSLLLYILKAFMYQNTYIQSLKSVMNTMIRFVIYI